MTLSLTNPALFREANFIDGAWLTAQSGASITVTNPFDGAVLGQVPSLSADEVGLAITASQTAQKSWASLTAKQRADYLHRWADLIDDNINDLAMILTAEQGKPLAEAKGEIVYANSFVRWFAEEGKRAYGDTIPTTDPTLRYVVSKQPVGVCVAITPWNFPCAMITRKVAPALAVGCTMIVKPSEETPFSALALCVLAEKAGIPKGVLQVVMGEPKTIGQVFCTDPRIAKLSFTGSTAVGKLLMAQSADTLKKLSLELGGNAPFIVFDDANLDTAVNALMLAKFRNAGQTCICANRIFVHKAIKDAFIDKLSQQVATLTVGNGLDDGVKIGTLINQKAFDKANALIQDALTKGARLVIGGDKHPSGQFVLMPTILDGVNETMDVAWAEIFAPVVAIFEFEEEDDVIARANATEYGLAGYFFTENTGRAWRVSERLDFGMVAQNTAKLSNEVAPFGGVKHSGFGREGSKYGIDEYLYVKYWCVGVQ